MEQSPEVMRHEQMSAVFCLFPSLSTVFSQCLATVGGISNPVFRAAHLAPQRVTSCHFQPVQRQPSVIKCSSHRPPECLHFEPGLFALVETIWPVGSTYTNMYRTYVISTPCPSVNSMYSKTVVDVRQKLGHLGDSAMTLYSTVL
jgi:hypothetical protein